MTEKQMISTLKGLTFGTVVGSKGVEALEMAIKALSQEPICDRDCEHCTWTECPIEPCDKCKYFDGNSCQHYDYKVGYTQGYEDASNRFGQEPCDDAISREYLKKIAGEYGYVSAYDIATAPSVTQKSGKWILLDECTNSGYYCSNCQKKLVKEGWSNTVKKIKYCPNCGAEMERDV